LCSFFEETSGRKFFILSHHLWWNIILSGMIPRPNACSWSRD
jgi:hypothetical protein